jgi:ankyrin repeat protein
MEAALVTFLSTTKVFSALQMLPSTAPADPRLFGKDRDYEQLNSNDGSTAVYMAVCFGLKVTLQALIAQGHRIDKTVPWGDLYSPLHSAVLLEDIEICKVLLQAGAQLNLQDRFGLTSLHLALHLQSG